MTEKVVASFLSPRTLSYFLLIVAASLTVLLFVQFGGRGSVSGDPEEFPSEGGHHDAAKKRHHSFQEEHFGEKGEHNPEADRKVIFGSEKAVHQFDDLTPEDSKKRLRALAKRMDTNNDSYVSRDELTEWVRNSIMSLDKEETKERFDELDEDKNNEITWDEYVREAFNTKAETFIVDREDKKLLEEDRKYFQAADQNGDGKLSFEEFSAFQNPENHAHMHQILIENTMAEKDTNMDGQIDFQEFMGGEGNMQPGSEWFMAEKTRFEEEYDKDKDGALAGDELRAWLVPDLTQTAQHEADHLIAEGDTDKDGQLSLDEVVEAHKHFVQSEATNYGEHLLDIRHDEL